MTEGVKWRFLIVEDNETIAQQLLEVVPSFVDAPDTAEADLCKTFKNATERLRQDRYDLLILDLKDDSGGFQPDQEDVAGLKVFGELRKTRFVPVVFYTAHAEWVRDKQTSFVRVVEKTETTEKVREEVRRVLATKVPMLTRRIEDIQRSYMWDFVTNNWKFFEQAADHADLAYLLARRLALSLEREAGTLAASVGDNPSAPSRASKAHPMMMYVVPKIGTDPLAGDIVVERDGKRVIYWLVLTPSCDFFQRKAHHVTLAKCELLKERDEYAKWAPPDRSNGALQAFERLITDNQGDRYKFLPRAFSIPDMVVDFQQLRSLEIKLLESFETVATLDSPFAESVFARFSRYFNRLGTPDLDKDVVINRLTGPSPSSTAEGTAPASQS